MRALQFGVVAACVLLCSRISPQGAVHRTKINPNDGLRYVWITGGTYLFGCSPDDRECFNWEKKPRTVSVGGLWIAQTETTQRAFERVMGTNPSLYRGPDRQVDR